MTAVSLKVRIANLPLAVKICAHPESSVGPYHYLDREEVALPLTGSVMIYAREAQAELQSGDAVILPAGQVHKVETLGPEQAEWLLVSPSGVGFFGADG